MENTISSEMQAEIVALRDEAIAGYTKHKGDFIALEEGYVNVLSDSIRKALYNKKKSALTPNLIKPKVDMLVRDVMKAFFGNDELAQITAEDKKDEHDIRVSDTLKAELKEYSRDRNLYSRCKPIVRDSIVYGTSIAKVYWNSRDNTCKIEHKKLTDVYFDLYAQTMGDIRFAVERVYMTIADLEKQYKRFDVDWNSYVNNTLISNVDAQNNEVNKYQRVEFHEVYRMKNGKWYVTTILNDDTILRLDKLLKDGLPFIASVLEPQFVMINEPITPTRAYGASFITPLLSIQRENTIKRNQQIDATDVQLNQRFITTKTSGLREDDLASNRKKIVVDNISNIKELPIPRLNDSIFDTNKLEAEAEQISGVTKFSQGLDTGGREKTAREITAIQGQGSSVIDDINRAFNENFFRPLVQRIAILTYKYKESKRFISIDRTKPLRQKIVINVGIGSTNKILALDNIDNAIATITQSLQMFMQVQDAKRVPLYLTMLDKMNMEKLKLLGQDSVIEEIEEQRDEQQKIMMQRQQQMQAQLDVMQQPQGMMQ